MKDYLVADIKNIESKNEFSIIVVQNNKVTLKERFTGSEKNFVSISRKYSYPVIVYKEDSLSNLKRLFKESYIPFYNVFDYLEKNNVLLFSYSIESLIDYYNLEVNLLENSLNNAESLLEIVNYIGTDNLHVSDSYDFNKQKRKTFYRNSSVKYGAFEGYNIVFTGRGPFTRGELMSLARKVGAEISSMISSRTNLLVVGEKPGSKFRKAQRRNIDIISMEEFFSILEGNNNIEDNVINNLYNEFSYNIKKLYSGKTIAVLCDCSETSNNLLQVLYKSGIDVSTYSEEDKTDILIYDIKYEKSEIIEKLEENNTQVMSIGEFTRSVTM